MMKISSTPGFLLLFGTVFLNEIFGHEHHNEGVKVRFNHEGLVKAHNLLLDSWKTILLESQLPSIKEANYIINFKIISVDLGKNDIATTPPNVIISDTRRGELVVKANWVLFFDKRGKYKHRSGSTLIKLTNISITRQVLLQFTEETFLTFVSGICQTSIGNLQLNFKARRYTESLFAHIFRNEIRKKVEGLLCQAAEGTVVTEFDKMLPLQRMTVPISSALFPMYKGILVDFAPTRLPILTRDDITFFSTGKCFPANTSFEDLKMLKSFTADPIPPFSESNRMFQFILGEYLLNTLNYAHFLNKAFYEIDPIDLFNEHFSSDISAAKLAEELPVFQNYVNRSIEFEISATSEPTTQITSDEIFTHENRRMIVNAILENGKRKAIVSLTYTNEIYSQLYVMNDLVHLRVTRMDSIADGIEPEALYFNTFRARANIFYLRFLNDVLARDPYIIPRNGPFKMVGIAVKLIQNGIEFGGDIAIEN